MRIDPARGTAAPSPRRGLSLAVAAALAATLAACQGGGLSGLTGGIPGITNIVETSEHGYIMPPRALEQVVVGSSKDQALVALGTPSTTANFEGEVFYYISQTRRRPVQFMNSRVIDQKVLAIYFDAARISRVTRIAQYGMQDGKIFDFISRTTPTGGADLVFIRQLLSVGNGPNPLSAFNQR